MEQVFVSHLVPATAAPTTAIVYFPLDPFCATHHNSTCPPLISEKVPMLTEALEQMIVDKPHPIIIPKLAELLGEDDPQEEPAPLSAIFILFSLMVSMPEVSGFSVLAALTSPIITPTSTAPPLLLSLDPITVLLLVEP